MRKNERTGIHKGINFVDILLDESEMENYEKYEQTECTQTASKLCSVPTPGFSRLNWGFR